MPKLRHCIWMLVLALPVLAGQPALAAGGAGKVQAVRGTAEATAADGTVRALKRRDLVYPGERIRTAARSHIWLRFDDGTRFDLGANADMTIDAFSDAADDLAEPVFSTSVLRGAFRFISGLIAKRRPQAMRVRTSVATIGIRGTHVAGEVEPGSARIMLMEPEDADRPTAIQVANQYGSVVIDEPGYGTEIPDAKSPPSPPRRMRLRTVDNLMRSLQSIQRMSVPRPRMH